MTECSPEADVVVRRSGESIDLCTDAGFVCTADHVDDAVSVAVRGDLDLATAPAFCEFVVRLLTEAPASITLDCAEVSFLDSSGIHALNSIRLSAERLRVALVLAAVPDQARRVLEITQMDTVFDIRRV